MTRHTANKAGINRSRVPPGSPYIYCGLWTESPIPSDNLNILMSRGDMQDQREFSKHQVPVGDKILP